VAACSDVPHLPQKFDAGGLSALHFAQTRASGLPHRAQKLLSAGFSQPHVEQRISGSLPWISHHRAGPQGNASDWLYDAM
jgi:hypothetical protein